MQRKLKLSWKDFAAIVLGAILLVLGFLFDVKVGLIMMGALIGANLMCLLLAHKFNNRIREETEDGNIHIDDVLVELGA